jgi:hypothetical protein
MRIEKSEIFHYFYFEVISPIIRKFLTEKKGYGIIQTYFLGGASE